MKRLVLLAAALLFSVAAQLSTLAQESFSEQVSQFIDHERGLIALENVKVLDGTGAPARENQTVLIDGGTIRSVGSSAEMNVPEGAVRLDLTGHTVTPGLVGLHNHTFYMTNQREIQLGYSAPLLYLASGVTTVRTTGSIAPYNELELKNDIESGDVAGPRLFITGPYITGSSGPTSSMAFLEGPDDARRVTRYWAEEGVDWMKAYTTISRAELKAAIDEAHAHGVKVTGHLCSVSFTEAVELGIDNIEHGLLTNTDYAANKQPDECPPGYQGSYMELDMESDEVQETFRAMIENGVGMTSTLAVFELFVEGRPKADDRSLAAMSPGTRDEYLSAYEQRVENGGVPVELWNKELEYELAFHRAGGLLAAGVDPTGNGGALPGYGDQRNYQLLVEGGFAPAEAVQVMTLNGARILEIESETGTIQSGKRADLVVFEGDLEADPASVTRATLVFKDGVGFNSARMTAAVEGLVGIK